MNSSAAAPAVWGGTRAELEATGPATLSQVMADVEEQVASADTSRLRPLATGFDPLDDVLNGGLRQGDLMLIGGAFGVGKTIFGLQVARNAVLADENTWAMYVCYEHDRAHMMQRLMCLESAERGYGPESLTLRKLGQMTFSAGDGTGLVSRLRSFPRYAAVVDAMESYADRLILVKASGDTSTLGDVRRWTEEALAGGADRLLVVVDYLQKIPVDWSQVQPETEVTTYLTQGLKEVAMSLGIRVLSIAASDRPGLQAKRMRLSHLRGSSALQYEADVGIILNNKFQIISRDHMVHNLSQAEAMRNWVVMTIEKNRSGRNAVDMEYELDASHFRIVPSGRVVRERLVDERLVLR
jgi:replicative DNA helicase